jgi:Ca-activated chloride channel homolog
MNFRKVWISAVFLALVLAPALGCRLTPAPNATAPQSEDAHVLQVLAGSELKDLEPLLPEIQQNTGVQLHFQYTGTLDGTQQILNGTQADLAWFSQAKYLDLTPGVRSKVLAQEKIMLSPVVLGIKESKAKAWGWLGSSNVTWADVVQKASSGDLHFAMTNPASSNSGFSALLGAAAALANPGGALQQSDVARVSAPLKGFLKGQALSAGSSGWLTDQYVLAQDRLDGMINYESVLLSLNQSGVLKEPLVLVYPRDGILTADYPLLLLNPARWDDYHKLVTYLRSASFQTEIMNQTLRRPVNSQVVLSSVFPRQMLVELPFPSTRAAVDALLSNFLDEQAQPAHTYFVIDTSGSMEGAHLDRVVSAMDVLTGQDPSLTGQFARFRSGEKVTILPFNSQVVGTFDFQVDPRQPASLQNIRDFVRSLKTGGNSATFSALEQAYTLAARARQQEPDDLYSIILMSDGGDNTGISPEQFQSDYRSMTGVENIPTFTILVGGSDPGPMQFIADLTHGRMFDASTQPLPLIFQEIQAPQ